MEINIKSLAAIAVVLTVTVIVLTITADINSSIQKSNKETVNVYVKNETFIARNATDGSIEFLNAIDGDRPYVASTGYVINGTSFQVIGMNNFSITASTGLITLANGWTQGLKINGTSMLITYYYSDAERDYAYNSTDAVQAGTFELASWTDTIGLVVGAVVLISFVYGIYRSRGE